jgi:hypothetical protein
MVASAWILLRVDYVTSSDHFLRELGILFHSAARKSSHMSVAAQRAVCASPDLIA